MHRRRLHLVLRTVGLTLVALCAGAWVVGRVCSDRYAWSQPISWAPTLLLAAPVWAATAVSALRARRRRRRERTAGRSPVRSTGPRLLLLAGLVFTVVSAAHLVFIELGLQRVARGRPRSAATTPLRLIFWNQAGYPADDLTPLFMAKDPTLLVISNRHSETPRDGLAGAFEAAGDAYSTQGWPFDVFSRLPITRWATTSLGLRGRSRRADNTMQSDTGWAGWYELRTDAGPLVLWVLDMPSDPALARYPLAVQAGEAIAGWRGAERVVEGDHSRFVRVETPGFPVPDIIVGDFNIPRGSASLDAFLRAAGVRGMRNAFDVAGSGWQRTWPRGAPVWAIDQCFVSGRLAVASFATADPGLGGHRMLVVDGARE